MSLVTGHALHACQWACFLGLANLKAFPPCLWWRGTYLPVGMLPRAYQFESDSVLSHWFAVLFPGWLLCKLTSHFSLQFLSNFDQTTSTFRCKLSDFSTTTRVVMKSLVKSQKCRSGMGQSPSLANYWESRVTLQTTKTIPLCSLLLGNPNHQLWSFN